MIPVVIMLNDIRKPLKRILRKQHNLFMSTRLSSENIPDGGALLQSLGSPVAGLTNRKEKTQSYFQLEIIENKM
jgi:hypothetical protein